MNIIQAFLETLLFILAVTVSFYLPGRLISNKFNFKFTYLENLFFNTIFGLGIFTLITYVLSWLKLNLLILPFLLILSFFSIKTKKIKISGYDFRDKLPLLIIIILSLIFSIPVTLSGQFGNSIILSGVNGFDAIWHISLINELVHHFPPDNPAFSGIPLMGYHYFFNFLLAKVVSTFNISALSLYFRFFPIFFALSWGFGVYVLTLRWTKKISSSLWAVFLTMFGGSFAFILRLYGHPGSLDDAFGITQPYTAVLNPPFASSVVLITATLFSLYKYFETKNKNYLYPIAIFAGIITMYKVYAGIILLGGLGLLSIVRFIKKDYSFSLSFLGALIIFYFTYWILRDPSSKLLFDPLWSPHKVLLDNLPWYRYDEKFYTYSRLHVKHGLFEIELFALVVFTVGNLGTRAVGMFMDLLLFLKKHKPASYFSLSVLFMLFISLLIPMFFIQSGKVFEIIQMAWYFLFFSAFFAADGFGKFFNQRLNRFLKLLLILVIIVVTLPSAYEKMSAYVAFAKGQVGKVTANYYKAALFLRSQGNYNSTVLEMPTGDVGVSLNTVDADAEWWYYRISSPRFIAFSDKRGFLENEGITFTGTDFKKRLNLITSIIRYEKFPEKDNYFRFQEEIEQGLKKYKIKYIASPYRLIRLEKVNIVKKIFENSEWVIYKVNITN